MTGKDPVMSSRAFRHIRTSLWFVPVLCVVAGVTLSFATIAVDRATGYRWVPQALTGGPDASVAILGTIATSMVTLTALVLTVTMVVVQLAMGQFSPRIVATFLQDKPSQLAIGLFVATFAHAMLAMREVDFADNTVPGLAVVVGYILVLVSIALLVVYVHHIGRSLRVSSLIELVGTGTRRTLDRMYPQEGSRPARIDRSVVCAPRSGVLARIDEDRLVEVAEHAGCRLEVLPGLGDFVPAGAPLVRIVGPAGGVDEQEVLAELTLSLDRSLERDVAYGLRMLVDIAERSLADSPFLDPTTAVQAIDRLHDCLRQLAPRPFPSGSLCDRNGELRVHIRRMDWADYLDLAFREIRLAGSGSPQVSRRLEDALLDLRSVAPPSRRPPIDEHLELLRVAVEAANAPWDVDAALVPDRQGLGTGAEARHAV
jgi:uncharacterized membrane protein